MLASLTDRIDQSVRFVSDADRTYAEALGKALYNPDVHAGKPGGITRAYGSALVGTPVADSIDMRRDAIQNMHGKERLINELVQMGMPVANIGARYGVPIAGVTAAGQGLYSLGQALSGQEVQDKGTLPM
tara:strand:- start:420 stop:809 length:390 start_codon:yes stop_codon:yes gene_type:complete